MITPTFHFKILENFVEVFSEKSEILVSKLQKEVGSQGFDVYPYITKCTLDIICGKHRGKLILFYNDNHRHTTVWSENLKGRDHLEVLGIDGMIIL
jgi:cytochrome P450 family 4